MREKARGERKRERKREREREKERKRKREREREREVRKQEGCNDSRSNVQGHGRHVVENAPDDAEASQAQPILVNCAKRKTHTHTHAQQ